MTAQNHALQQHNAGVHDEEKPFTSRPGTLGLLHPDGTPVTLDDCARQYQAAVTEGVTLRAARDGVKDAASVEKRDLDPEEAALVRELERDAALSNLRARAWGALHALAREGQRA